MLVQKRLSLDIVDRRAGRNQLHLLLLLPAVFICHTFEGTSVVQIWYRFECRKPSHTSWQVRGAARFTNAVVPGNSTPGCSTVPVTRIDASHTSTSSLSHSEYHSPTRGYRMEVRCRLSRGIYVCNGPDWRGKPARQTLIVGWCRTDRPGGLVSVSCPRRRLLSRASPSIPAQDSPFRNLCAALHLSS